MEKLLSRLWRFEIVVRGVVAPERLKLPHASDSDCFFFFSKGILFNLKQLHQHDTIMHY
jgi:hypothetical protein